jgi:hypothetical protein
MRLLGWLQTTSVCYRAATRDGVWTVYSCQINSTFTGFPKMLFFLRRSPFIPCTCQSGGGLQERSREPDQGKSIFMKRRLAVFVRMPS